MYALRTLLHRYWELQCGSLVPWVCVWWLEVAVSCLPVIFCILLFWGRIFHRPCRSFSGQDELASELTVLPSEHWIAGVYHYITPSFLHGDSESELRFPCCLYNHFLLLSHLPSLGTCFFFFLNKTILPFLLFRKLNTAKDKKYE